MTCLVSLILSFTIFILKVSCDFTDYYWYPITSYTFYPKLGDCYEIYDQNEKVTSVTCQRQANLEKQSCIDWIPGNKHCLGLKTPTNETIELGCKDADEPYQHSYYNRRDCFKVHKVDKTFETICQQKFDAYSIGITTPDNFTILLESYGCKTSMSIDDRKTFNNFVNSYSFDPELKSCYKVFNPNQIVSPYTCFNKDICESCIHELPKYNNCMGIITQNNETVILDCADESGEHSSSTRNCFKIYTSDDDVHVACQKKVEERCVGITTPSNLTVLLDCSYCFNLNATYLNNIDDEIKKKYRHFVKSYLDKEYKGENSYLETIAFEVFDRNDFVKPPNCFESERKVYAYWLPNTNCYGVTLESNETIILGCTPKENKVKPGCFQVVDSRQEKVVVCAKVLDEFCVGIITPRNLSVVLSCYPIHDCFEDWEERYKDNYVKRLNETFRLFPRLQACYEVYSENQEVNPYNCRNKATPERYACIDWIPGKKECLGLKTPQNETIELRCGPTDSISFAPYQLSKCFDVYSPEGNVKNVCQKKFGNYSIGITTPKNNSILFGSYFCQETKTLEEIRSYKHFIENFSFDPDLRSCYKIFTQDQVVSPFYCLHRDIYEACIHQLHDSNCTGIRTQNNETVVLHCSHEDREENELGCFRIYTPDNKVHRACQRQLEESCIGITTPSNLSVLFECHTCTSTRGSLPFYQNPFRKNFRKFVESALYNYTHGYYTIRDGYRVFTERGSRKTEAVHLLRGHNNCRGLTLRNFETIVLECPNKIPEKYGCFDVYSPKYDNTGNSPEQKVQSVCIKVFDENCVGIITPKNWTLALDCIFEPQISYPSPAIVVPHNRMPPRM